MPRKQYGFTIVEIAIVLIIIGLLLGGVLKGQELVNSARVRNLADTNSGIQAAYYGFIDRYRQVPGDMTATAAASAIGDSTITAGGDADGRVDNADWGEASALWVHLTRAGFLQGSYDGGATDSTTYRDADMAPRNAFDGYMLLGRTRDYSTADGAPTATRTTRLGLVLGDNIPVDIARELDLKIDDQRPLTGSLRFTGTTTFSHAGVSEGDDAVHGRRGFERIRRRRRRPELQPRLHLLSPAPASGGAPMPGMTSFTPAPRTYALNGGSGSCAAGA